MKTELMATVSHSALRTRRGCGESEIDHFISLCADPANDGKTIRVYSSAGFVPKNYRGTCKIERITRDGKSGRVYTDWGDAHRSGGAGSTQIVVNRSL